MILIYFFKLNNINILFIKIKFIKNFILLIKFYLLLNKYKLLIKKIYNNNIKNKKKKLYYLYSYSKINKFIYLFF